MLDSLVRLPHSKVSSIQDEAGKSLTEEKDIIKRWIEYCSKLYNHPIQGDPEDLSVPGLDLAIRALAIFVDSLVITLPKKGNLQLCSNYRTISLISHPSKVMLKVLLNRLKPQAENIIAKKQAGFREERSTTEQIFKLIILCEKLTPETCEWFQTTVGVRQGCLLSPTLFNIFLERIMTEALDEHEGSVSIGDRTITNLRSADDIDGLAGEEQELRDFVNRLNTTSTEYGIEMSAEKTKIMPNNPHGIISDITIKYLRVAISDEGSGPEIRTRIAQTTATLAKLKPIWKNKNVTEIKVKTISNFLYACESSTLIAELERKIQAVEMRCYRRTLGISFRVHVTNEAVRKIITDQPSEDENYSGMATSGMVKTILQGTVKSGRRRGRRKKKWIDNIKEWTDADFASTQVQSKDREQWRELSTPDARPSVTVYALGFGPPLLFLRYHPRIHLFCCRPSRPPPICAPILLPSVSCDADCSRKSSLSMAGAPHVFTRGSNYIEKKNTLNMRNGEIPV
ncbi:uncharacterized protein LOC125025311 [Penaeus chinensis]|uniref:uncharacterized protein LOC125025311 n=1 Tax=Penaeus chinensis TaxID=139456 RepID=UPI001FB7E22F|nr:uncharacterized protein LOC125025311 [Penaeus chinensis]